MTLNTGGRAAAPSWKPLAHGLAVSRAINGKASPWASLAIAGIQSLMPTENENHSHLVQTSLSITK